MGYMTYYSLVVGDEDREEVLGRIERDGIFRRELEDFHECGLSGYAKCYYLGGRMQEAPAEVDYPLFDSEALAASETPNNVTEFQE